MTKKKKIILGIVAVVLALAAYGYFFGVQTECVITSRLFFNRPCLTIVPKPMAVESWSEPDATLEAFDYSFSVPWDGFVQKMTVPGAVWWATPNTNISILCISPSGGLYGALLDARQDRHNRTLVDALNKDGVSNTNYYMWSKMWNVTPQSISLFDSRLEAKEKSGLLVLKAIVAPTNLTHVLSFDTGNVKGFQKGVPSADSDVLLTLFDRFDREIKIAISRKASFPITQADINTIITTFSSKP